MIWKPAQPRKVKIKSLFLKAYNRTHSTRGKASQIVGENLTNSVKSRKCRRLIRELYCTSFAVQQFDELVTFYSISYLTIVSSKRSKSAFFSRKQAQSDRKSEGLLFLTSLILGPKLFRRSCDLHHIYIKQGNRYLRFCRIISFQSDLEAIIPSFMTFYLPFGSVTRN